MKRYSKIIIGAALLAVLGTAIWWGFNRGKEVEAVQVQQGGIIRTVSDIGYVRPATDYNLHATQSARAIDVPVKTGESVKQGQTLVVLENLDLAVQINEVRSQQAQAVTSAAETRAATERLQLELNDANDNLNRTKELYQAGAATKVEYDLAKLAVETNQQSLNEKKRSWKAPWPSRIS